MDKISERETHDLMNVESFSQLPFIRPAPPVKEKGIRLFGIEFGATTDDSDLTETTNNNNNNAFGTDSTTTNNKDNNNNNNINNSNNSTENNVESNRRFECHYCCRNFPTSQALGGHQNAHKRERQHAKRAHLQSTMVHATSFSSDPHLYHHNPFINYRFTSPSSTSSTTYPTWNSNNSSNSLLNGSAARFYGTHSHAHSHPHLASSYSQSQQQQPITGSPLAFWRIPNGVVHSNSSPSFNNHERSLQPLLAFDERTSSFSQVGPSASQNRYVYDSKRSVDHVSLDLHL